MYIDVLYELEQYDWRNVRLSSEKFIASSPFRADDDTPSFFVDLREDSEYYGCWLDSGGTDPEWTSGNFTKLLSFLMDVSYREADEYLRHKYGNDAKQDTPTLRRIRLPAKRPKKSVLNAELLEQYRHDHPYLASRCISAEVQREMQTGYCPSKKAVTIPWFGPNGQLLNIKYRSVTGKKFWYVKGGRPIKELVYGIDYIYRHRCRRAAIVEAEIDALTLMSAGIPAIAAGGGVINEEKAAVIIRSPIEEIFVMSDHDDVGQALKREVIRMLGGDLCVGVAGFPKRYKDVNEAVQAEGLQKLREYFERRKLCKKFLN
ncbi:toprim domain-containing protein [Paenibacillus larvae]|uniref:TOPRIM DNA primase n=4 Tax=Halcyonevirus TaxID=2843388 RepID=A0A345ASK3_9CAUD|nr:toprim domain-containing protein [Paenibacillus larvae]YP_009210574.1 DNA primase [Paenibacillus phage Tripp]YP_010082213.1 DNA primase [Paenibacillus phage C7Cdelta]AXF39973.1 DNA primase [Paenibacillus phage Ash]AXF40260.1 DNA primase [Paenibacillus phage Ley]ALH46427.1 DNA primase [Paenibacillus phage Tripp]AXF39807.1 TOPRIM DNA primase [Paenibacillus phage C7Cdelta]ETK28016.1 bacterial DNA primase [Paenibacillus larvae subsp. larvae DSM 25719]